MLKVQNFNTLVVNINTFSSFKLNRKQLSETDIK